MSRVGPRVQAPPTPEQRRRMIEGTVAVQFAAIPAAAEGCDVIVAGGAMSMAAHSVAERLGIAYVYVSYCPVTLPSPHHAPVPVWGQAPADATAGNRALWAEDARRWNGTVGAAINAHRAAARALGRRVIVLRGWAGLSPADDGPDCLPVDEVDQQALFPRVAAVVHHGGAGTTTAAALAGAPQVVVPQLYDQHYWARRAGDLGIGIADPPAAPTAESLAEALGRVLHPDVAARAASVAGEVRTDGAEVAAQRLIDGA
ncbi:glycosyltransferase [Microbispora rosea]|nr:nucleotide disphospho-sugar-binding domain-containing protein [Microbispora rosea]